MEDPSENDNKRSTAVYRLIDVIRKWSVVHHPICQNCPQSPDDISRILVINWCLRRH